MKKLGCIIILILAVLGFLGVTIIGGIGAGISEAAKREEAAKTPEQREAEKRQKAEAAAKVAKEEAEKAAKQKAGYDRGYPIGKLAATEGRPERSVADLQDFGSRIGNGNYHYSVGFRKGWKDGYRQQKYDMERLGIKPQPYVPPANN